jgi:hypothetical protein
MSNDAYAEDSLHITCEALEINQDAINQVSTVFQAISRLIVNLTLSHLNACVNLSLTSQMLVKSVKVLKRENQFLP